MVGPHWGTATVARRVPCVARVPVIANVQTLASEVQAPTLTKLQQVARDKELWNQARAIAFAIKFLMILMGRLQGCHCHEEELKEGKNVHCNMKGCRAKSSAAYLRSLIQDIHHERDNFAPGAFGTVPVEFV